MCKNSLYHAVLTINMIYLDKTGQVLSNQLATVEIILRKSRCSQIPFAGVMIDGTIDPEQLQPINQQPFRISSLMLTCFVMVGLKNSVRTHSNQYFQQLQDMTRMDPYDLRKN